MICRQCEAEFQPDNPRQRYCNLKCKRKKQASKYRNCNIEKIKTSKAKSYLKRKYGISPEEKTDLLEKQGNTCAVCNGSDPRSSLGWSIDHDHSSGKIRGILCMRCNTLIGTLGDNLESITKFCKQILDYIHASII